MKHKSKQTFPLLPIVSKILAAIVLLSYLWAVYAVATVEILPGKYFWPGVIVSALIVIATVVVLWQAKQPVRKIGYSFAVIVALLVVIMSGYAIASSQSTLSFIDKIQGGNVQYEEYSIIALKTHSKDLASASGKAMTQLIDTNRDAVRDEVAKRVNVTMKEVSDPASLAAALENHSADTAVLKSSYLDIFADNGSDFSSKIQVLATFRIKVTQVSATKKTDVNKPFVLYISGIDTYGGIDTVSRSDVNMLMAVNPQTHKILLVNTPRDYYVQLHGTTGVRDKLTHAGIYGIDMSVLTLQDLYGAPINYYVRVNFSSLVKLIDTLGGVNVYSDYSFKSFQQGYNQLDGKKALEFSRERYSFQDGDRQRGKNQQRVIEAIIAKMNDPQNLIRYQAILEALSGAIQTNMAKSEVTTLANKQLDSLAKWEVESMSADGAGDTQPTYSMGSLPLYVMQPDAQTVEAIKEKLRVLLATD